MCTSFLLTSVVKDSDLDPNQTSKSAGSAGVGGGKIGRRAAGLGFLASASWELGVGSWLDQGHCW